MKKRELLTKIFLFDRLSPEQLEQVEQFATIKTYSRGEWIFHEGDTANAFYAIVSGRIKIFRFSANGDEHIIHIVDEDSDDLIAEAAIFDLKTYPAHCQSLKQTILIRFPRNDFVNFILSNPEVGIRMMAAYSKRLREFVEMVEGLVFYDVKSRLAKYLIENSRMRGDQQICSLIGSKKELAAVLGTIPETLSRTLYYFKSKKIIDEDQRDIIILDHRKLESFFS